MVDERTIERAAALLLEAASPGSRVILFGSHARGDAGPDSDLDFLVIEPRLHGRLSEAVRLRRALSPLRVPADVIVTDEDHFDYWRDTPNNIMYAAAREGRVLR